MSRPSSSSPWGVLAPVLLLLGGMAVAVVMFAHGRSGPARTVPPEAAGMAAGAPGDSAAAAAAHAAAGVTAGGGDASKVFAERRHELGARLAEDPERRDLVLQMARLLHDGHRPREAVPFYRKAIELDGTDAQAYYDLASVHAELGEWDLAADALQSRLDRDGGDAVALYDLGAVRANQGRSDEARALFERARAATSDGALLARIAQALARLKGA